jgi:serine/threonine protein kinase
MLKKYGPFPEEIVGMYLEQVLNGLDYLHGKRVIHHDIKGKLFRVQ